MSSTDVLLNVATAAQLFHASDGTGFADLIIEDHRETWPLRSKRFQAWLRQQYYERTWDAPSPGALNAALNVLEAQAQFDGPQRKVSARLAEQDGLIYLDLADEFWRCIEIGPNGWRIAEDPPVRFRRSAGMQPLPHSINAFCNKICQLQTHAPQQTALYSITSSASASNLSLSRTR